MPVNNPIGRAPIELPIEEIVQLYKEGYNLKEIGYLYEVSYHTIARRLEAANVKLRVRTQVLESRIMKCEVCSIEIETKAYNRKHCSDCKKKENTKRQYERWQAGERTPSWKKMQSLRKSEPGPCDICSVVAPLHMDHDHRHCIRGCEMCIRGYLCLGCNMGLGQFSDDIIKLESSINYLKNWELQCQF